MKLVVLSPNWETLLTEEQKQVLKNTRDCVFVSKIAPLSQVSELAGDGEKIIAIDPDFCNWKIENAEVDKIQGLKAICLQSTSFSWVDGEYLKSKNIPVTNLRGFSSIAVSEWAFMMALNLARKLPVVIKDGWKQDYTKHQGVELRGKTAGIVGLGNIGTKIAENCKGFGMEVIYWSKNSRNADFQYKSIEEIMKTADVIFPAVAQNSETNGLITDDMINSLKKGAIFVSIVHHVYNHELLLERARKGEIYGYGFEQADASMTNYEGNVWAGPELAWATDGSMKRNSEMWVESIMRALKGEYPTRVN